MNRLARATLLPLLSLTGRFDSNRATPLFAILSWIALLDIVHGHVGHEFRDCRGRSLPLLGTLEGNRIVVSHNGDWLPVIQAVGQLQEAVDRVGWIDWSNPSAEVRCCCCTFVVTAVDSSLACAVPPRSRRHTPLVVGFYSHYTRKPRNVRAAMAAKQETVSASADSLEVYSRLCDSHTCQ